MVQRCEIVAPNLKACVRKRVASSGNGVVLHTSVASQSHQLPAARRERGHKGAEMVQQWSSAPDPHTFTLSATVSHLQSALRVTIVLLPCPLSPSCPDTRHQPDMVQQWSSALRPPPDPHTYTLSATVSHLQSAALPSC